jgi:biotin carboxylase
MTRLVDKLEKQAKHKAWQAVVSNHEQFGALTAALLAERLGWPGTPVEAVLACQHKLHARQVLEQVCPEANTPFAPLSARYGDPAPDGLSYPLFIKPVKAAFSVLARRVRNREELHELTRFGAWERWVIRHLVEPFERIARLRLPQAGTAHRLLIEAPVQTRQYNLDGYVIADEMRPLGIVESVMYPDTQAFARFVYPCHIEAAGEAKAIETARRFLKAVGFTHGLFNMEFFYDAATDKLTVIEFNPRMAAQFSDLYLRVDGIDLHRIALELAHGRDPALLPRTAPGAGVAASFVYRAFAEKEVAAMPGPARAQDFSRRFPDALLFTFPKPRGSMKRDFKWLGSYRYGIIHLGGCDNTDLLNRCREASELLGWPSPCIRLRDTTNSDLPALAAEAT